MAEAKHKERNKEREKRKGRQVGRQTDSASFRSRYLTLPSMKFCSKYQLKFQFLHKKALHLHYKGQTVNAAQGNNRCFCENHVTYKYTVREHFESSELLGFWTSSIVQYSN
jgi:hypothetical protein